jgi:hypothetical protein
MAVQHFAATLRFPDATDANCGVKIQYLFKPSAMPTHLPQERVHENLAH